METLNMLEYLSANEPGPFCSAVNKKKRILFFLFDYFVFRN
jgi:hypothetical protein